MGERAKQGPARAIAGTAATGAAADFDTARADAVLPLIARILGLEGPP